MQNENDLNFFYKNRTQAAPHHVIFRGRFLNSEGEVRWRQLLKFLAFLFEGKEHQEDDSLMVKPRCSFVVWMLYNYCHFSVQIIMGSNIWWNVERRVVMSSSCTGLKRGQNICNTIRELMDKFFVTSQVADMTMVWPDNVHSKLPYHDLPTLPPLQMNQIELATNNYWWQHSCELCNLLHPDA